VTDLTPQAVDAALGSRETRVYPALLSTQADALAWARAGAPEGAVVVADYQVSPRGRAGLEWTVQPGRGLSFSMVLRPSLAVEREGWLYAVAVSAMADLHPGSTITWPDEVGSPADRQAAVGVHAELGPAGVLWAVVSVLIEQASPPRAGLLAAAVEAIEQRYHEEAGVLLDDYRDRCHTLGRKVRARLIPMGPGGPEVTGEAMDVKDDGALVLLTERGNRVAVRPQNLGLLEPAEQAP
jgi:BirA family transcriptional regulator, biotin operon repressor / biotin---[acetyl-CoA-carboxylase] ligase